MTGLYEMYCKYFELNSNQYEEAMEYELADDYASEAFFGSGENPDYVDYDLESE